MVFSQEMQALNEQFFRDTSEFMMQCIKNNLKLPKGYSSRQKEICMELKNGTMPDLNEALIGPLREMLSQTSLAQAQVNFIATRIAAIESFISDMQRSIQEKFNKDFQTVFMEATGYFSENNQPVENLQTILEHGTHNLEIPSVAVVGYMKFNQVGAPHRESELYQHKIHLSANIIDNADYQKGLAVVLRALNEIPLITNAKIYDPARIKGFQKKLSSGEGQLDVDPSKALTLYFPSLEFAQKSQPGLTDEEYRRQQRDAIVQLDKICKEIDLQPLTNANGEAVTPKGEYSAKTFGTDSDLIWVTPKSLTASGQTILAQDRTIRAEDNPYAEFNGAPANQDRVTQSESSGELSNKNKENQQTERQSVRPNRKSILLRASGLNRVQNPESPPEQMPENAENKKTTWVKGKIRR